MNNRYSIASAKFSRLLLAAFFFLQVNFCTVSQPSGTAGGEILPSTDTIEEAEKVAVPAPVVPLLPLDNCIYRPDIHSIISNVNGSPLAFPVIALYGPDTLTYSFDILGEHAPDLDYTLIHCDANWLPSAMNPEDYLSGYVMANISDYTFSRGTRQPYVHYSLPLPNADLQFTKSGNYLLRIFHAGEADSIVLQQRFCVVEQKVNIEISVRRPGLPAFADTHQEVDFTINHVGMDISDPYEQVKVTVLQNGRWDDAIFHLKPVFLKEDQLVYDHDRENLFDGGNEYRYFNFPNLDFYSGSIKEILLIGDTQTIYLQPDRIRSFQKYQRTADLDGGYFINREQARNTALESEYAEVLFTLPFARPLAQGSLHVLGGFNNWQADSSNQMHYNESRQAYEISLFLKQGHYDYVYGLHNSDNTPIDFEFIEGNHYETENDYLVLVYFKGFADRYDSLIGVKSVRN